MLQTGRRLMLAGLCDGVLFTAACDEDVTSPAAAGEADRAFIDGMVPHHEAATMMADEALAKAARPELKEMAGQLKADPAREISQLKAWRREWFDSDSTPDPMRMAPIPAGPDFDRVWMQEMIKHHQGAIDMSTLAKDAETRSEVCELAEEIIAAQRAEQAQLRQWLQQWYGVSFSRSSR